ncbi:MAG: AtpZ/AtpI family protein [Solirubrobacterales bacterium]
MASKPGNWARSAGDALALATTFAFCIGAGYWIGQWLDTRFGTQPYLMLVMILLGLAAGLKMLYERAVGNTPISPPPPDPEDQKLSRFSPSKEVLDAMAEAKKMLAEIDPSVISGQRKEKKEEP